MLNGEIGSDNSSNYHQSVGGGARLQTHQGNVSPPLPRATSTSHDSFKNPNNKEIDYNCKKALILPLAVTTTDNSHEDTTGAIGNSPGQQRLIRQPAAHHHAIGSGVAPEFRSLFSPNADVNNVSICPTGTGNNERTPGIISAPSQSPAGKIGGQTKVS